jgi:hypothetical protein
MNEGSHGKGPLVYYDGNEGKTPTGRTVIETYDTVVLGLNLFQYYGFECVCWNDKRDGSGTDYMPNANVMPGTWLYAQWEEAELPQMLVTTDNEYSDVLSFILGNDISIDRNGLYDVPYGSDIHIEAKGVADDPEIIGKIITMKVGGSLYTIEIELKNGTLGEIHPFQGKAIIPFKIDIGEVAEFSYKISVMSC